MLIKSQSFSSTKYEIASNTKAFTGLAILKLAQEGRLNLNDAVSKHVPHFKMNYNGQNETITIKQLWLKQVVYLVILQAKTP